MEWFKDASDANFTHWLASNKALLQTQPAIPYLNEGFIYALEISKEEANKILYAFVSTYPELKKGIMQAIRKIEEKSKAKHRKEGIQTRNL